MNKEMIRKAAQQIRKDGVAAIMIAPGADMVFLLGRKPLLCERFQALIITEKEECFYICNDLYADEMAELLDKDSIYHWSDSNGFGDTFREAFRQYGLEGKKIAVNGGVRACNLILAMKACPFIPVNGKDYIEKTRIIKTPEEMENLRMASRIADKAVEGVRELIHPGMTEKQVNEEIIRLCLENGAEYTQGGIVAVNEHAALPHYMGSDGIIGPKSIVLMDFGCTWKGMWSDTTRCLFLGKATEREKEIYQLVLEANLAGEAAARNGAWIPDVDQAARSVIEAAGYGPYFNHRLGHGIGYDMHEAPYIRGDYEMYLAPGMAFSCEPGIYIKDEIGIRIEDLVMINEKGETEILNHSSKELIEI